MKLKLIYHISGVLPAPWEDFYCETDSGSSVHIGDKFQSDALELPDYLMFVTEGPNEWGDYYATVHELNVDTAKLVLANVNSVGSDEIEIVQEGVCISI